jgi:hypothetical protein
MFCLRKLKLSNRLDCLCINEKKYLYFLVNYAFNAWLKKLGCSIKKQKFYNQLSLQLNKFTQGSVFNPQKKCTVVGLKWHDYCGTIYSMWFYAIFCHTNNNLTPFYYFPPNILRSKITNIRNNTDLKNVILHFNHFKFVLVT